MMRPQRLGQIVIPDDELAQDKKTCRRFGPCGVGRRAIYLNSFYIDRRFYVSMDSVTRIFKRIAMSKGGFTGKGVFGSLPYLVVEYDNGKQKQCNFKHEEDVDRLLTYVEAHFPGIPLHSVEAERKLAEKEKRLARQSMGMIFQQFNLLAQRNVLQNVCFPMEIAHMDSRKAKERAKELLKLVGLEERMNAYPAQLSGGQKQRVAIARAMATNPRVLLCDEATSALDPNTTKSILELLKKINREMGITVIMITHEMAVIEAICDRVAIIDHSHIAESGKVSDIFSGPKSDIGRQLILGDTSDQTKNFGGSRMIRVIFDGRESSEPIIANMILACKAPVNIMHADTRDIEGKAMGQMLLQLPEDTVDADRICNYLRTAGVTFEEVH